MHEPDDEVTEGTADDFVSGDAVVIFCDDGRVHAFRVLDDGLGDRPACGAGARQLRPASGSDVVCTLCIGVVADFLDSDADTIQAAVRQVIGDTETDEKE